MPTINLKLAGATAVASLALVGATATPASAQPVVTGGLVNVTVTNLLNNNTVTVLDDARVGVAVNLAANICGVAVAVLAEQLGSGDATCQIGDQLVTITQ